MQLKYIKYKSESNTVGLDEKIINYWSIDEEDFVTKSIDILSNGETLKYDEEHKVDEYSQLPEGQIKQANLDDKSYGICTEITQSEFQEIWIRPSLNRL